MKRYVRGTLVKDGGLFQKTEQAINYLESHDDHTFGDFVRIAIGAVKVEACIQEVNDHVHLTEQQMRINKLGALFLFVAQGAVMIHAGQEFARSKVIAPSTVADPHSGQIDHNSYNKDNETNWINYQHKEINGKLYDYYKGLVALRKAHPALRRSDRRHVHFLKCNNEFGLGFWVDKTSSGDSHDILVLMNADPQHAVTFKLPPGQWSLVVNGNQAGTEILKPGIVDQIKVLATTGMVMVR